MKATIQRRTLLARLAAVASIAAYAKQFQVKVW